MYIQYMTDVVAIGFRWVSLIGRKPGKQLWGERTFKQQSGPVFVRCTSRKNASTELDKQSDCTRVCLVAVMSMLVSC